MDIFSENDQRQLLTIKGLHRLTRNDLADQIGVSLPTMTKLINSPAPMVLQGTIYKKVKTWLKKQKSSINKYK
nr:MAG TPA: Transcriptional regulator [Caudoviricetes sp.]